MERTITLTFFTVAPIKTNPHSFSSLGRPQAVELTNLDKNIANDGPLFFATVASIMCVAFASMVLLASDSGSRSPGALLPAGGGGGGGGGGAGGLVGGGGGLYCSPYNICIRGNCIVPLPNSCSPL